MIDGKKRPARDVRRAGSIKKSRASDRNAQPEKVDRILKRPIKRITTPPKSVQAKVAKRPASTAKAAVTAVNKSTATKEKLPNDGAALGHYQLSPMMSRMLEKELEDVMGKIFSVLPKNVTDLVEKKVIENFRGNAGEDLKRALGLNITKRLLNVHNDLFVKIVFSERPEKADLAVFLRQYKICAFKHTGLKGYTFAAKVREIDTFDELCSNKELTCGNTKVTVTPCYKYLQCPPNLVTSYAIKQNEISAPKSDTVDNKESITKENESSKLNESKENAFKQHKVDSDAHKTVAIKQTAADNSSKSKTETQNVNTNHLESKVKKSNDANVTVKKDGTQTLGTNVTKTTQKTLNQIQSNVKDVTVSNKADDKKETNSNHFKLVSPKTNTSKVTNNAAKANVKDLIASNKADEKKETNSNSLKVVSSETNTSKASNNTAKTNVKDVTVSNKADKKKETKSNSLKVVSSETNTNKISNNAAKTNVKQNVPSNISPGKVKKSAQYLKTGSGKIKQTSDKKESDYDELSDHDILALISGGIVLDECSGSEEE